MGTQIHRNTQIYKRTEAPHPRSLVIAHWHEAVQNPPHNRYTSNTPSPLRILVFGCRAFHTIHKTVAINVDVAVGVSGLAYIALNVLPCLDVRRPYRTPITEILWYPRHALLSSAALFLHKSILGLH